MKASLKAGCNFWNAGEFYGTPEYNSLHLMQQYFSKYPEDAEKVVLSIKGGSKPGGQGLDCGPANVRRSVEYCVETLKGTKKIDIFECARVDKNVPIETTMKALAELREEGKIGAISLSELGAEKIQRAVKVTKIVGVEVEVSMFATDIFSNGVAAACAEHNIPVIAYSPMSRGMLTGQIKKFEDIPEGDFRRMAPRFQPGNFATNMELVKEVEKISEKKGCTPAQLAISWVKAQSKRNGNPEIIPIPGATTEERVLENAKDVSITDAELAEIDEILKKCEVAGERYPPQIAQHWDF